MPPESWTTTIVRSYLQTATEEEMIDLIHIVFPLVVDSLSKPQLKRLIKELFNQHLSTLLADMNTEERAEILEAVLPAITREFPLTRVDWTQVVASSDSPECDAS